MTLEACEIESPIDRFWIAANDQGLAAVLFEDEPRLFRVALERRLGPVRACAPTASTVLGRAASALAAYFAGDLGAIDELPVHAPGTPFQQLVWSELRRVPAGTTISYAQLAAQVGNARAVRAVAAANARNPVAIVVPCHRVIGSDGTLTGYRGGLARKRWLFDHERRQVDDGLRASGSGT